MKEQLLENPVFRMAVEQFDRAAGYLELSEDVSERTKWPKRLITVTVPVRMDNGKVEMFFAHRVHYHLSRGPTKGGLRYHPKVDLGEVTALAMWMNWKCALLKLPYGGGKGGIACHPRAMSMRELEALTRRFAQEMIPFIGEEVDIMAPDVGTNEQVMAWILDVYSTHAGRLVPGIVTGKPVHLQGSEGRVEATGHGVAFLASRAMDRLGIKAGEATAILQGFGNVGRYAALTLSSFGVKIIGVSDLSGAILNTGGIDVHKLCEHVDATGGVAGFEGAGGFDPAELLVQKCDVLIPAALDMVVTKENAAQLRCRILAEAANGPTTPEADAILEDRGDIFLLPDILCNAGGVVVSYLEWVHNLQRFSWTHSEIITKLESKMEEAFERVMSYAHYRRTPHRLAALALGIKEVAAVKMTRGLFP